MFRPKESMGELTSTAGDGHFGPGAERIDQTRHELPYGTWSPNNFIYTTTIYV